MDFQTKPRNVKYIDQERIFSRFGLTRKIVCEIGQPDMERGGVAYYRLERVKAWVLRNKGRLEALDWARSVAIEIAPIDASILEQARLYYRSESVAGNGLIAYAMHSCSNYEFLLLDLRGRLGIPDRRAFALGVESAACGEIKARCYQEARRALASVFPKIASFEPVETSAGQGEIDAENQ